MGSNWQEQIYEANRHRVKGDAAQPAQEKTPTIIRQAQKPPNKTEERFRLTYLETWKAAGIIESYRFEDITLRLAPGLRYTPDFAVYRKEGRNAFAVDFYECKGGGPIRDDAIVKLKLAPVVYPQHRFWLYRWKGGIWIPQLLKPGFTF